MREQRRRYCKNCGAELLESTDLCPRCDAGFNKQTPKTAEKKEINLKTPINEVNLNQPLSTFLKIVVILVGIFIGWTLIGVVANILWWDVGIDYPYDRIGGFIVGILVMLGGVIFAFKPQTRPVLLLISLLSFVGVILAAVVGRFGLLFGLVLIIFTILYTLRGKK